MSRLRNRPDRFNWKGDDYAFHRLQDGPTLARLDPYSDIPQRWLLHSGKVLHLTGAEVRDVAKQVNGTELPETRPEGVRHHQIIEQRITAVKVEMDEAARARISELERQMADLIARLDATTAKVTEESQEPVADLSENFADLMLADETVEDARERLTRQLVYLRHVLIAPEARGYPMTPDEQAQLQDIERRQALGKWLNA